MSSTQAQTSSPIVTRFAPSPTGHLHIGGARSALFCWAFARKQKHAGHDGRFMIRIEDTDQARSSDESAKGILEDLAWLGIEWNDGPVLEVNPIGRDGQHAGARTIGGDSRKVGPYFQARRVAIYNAYIEHLMDIGRAYPAFDTSEELDAMRKAAVAKKETFKYPRPADVKLGAPSAERLAKARQKNADGSFVHPHVVRFAMDAEAVSVMDSVLGEVKIAPGEVDDFVIRKADGFPTYHFAVVIDDELMGVTHVMRAQEHLANTPRHVALQRALTRLEEGVKGTAFRVPAYAHMPLIFNNDGSKMSKRDKAKTARKAAKDAIAKGSATAASLASATGLDAKVLADFLAAENDRIDVAQALAKQLNVVLPEIEIYDFRQSGYLPEAIINFIALLGWNPGLKLPDGKDLEKFDMAFIGEHFSIERIGRTNAKFDRAKLLSFNADSINALSDEAFARRWMAWCAEFEPQTARALLPRLGAAGETNVRPALLWFARAIKPRARTLRDGLKSAGFLLLDDSSFPFDPAAVEKGLLANDRQGLALLRTAHERLARLSESEFTPELLHPIIEQIAMQTPGADGKPAMGPVSQALRVAVTGTMVSPGMGETLAVLGRASVLARIERCLKVHSV